VRQQLATDLLISPYLKEERVGRGHGQDTGRPKVRPMAGFQSDENAESDRFVEWRLSTRNAYNVMKNTAKCSARLSLSWSTTAMRIMMVF
jgi:hypothetical protein